MDEKHFEVMRILQLDNINKVWNQFPFSVIETSLLFTSHDEIMKHIYFLETKKLILTDKKTGELYLSDKAKDIYKEHPTANTSFEELCDIVLNYIVEQDKLNKTFNSLELSKTLKIDYDTIEAMADEFYGRKFIALSSTSGHSNFHVLPAANSFIRKTSFLEEKQSRTNAAINIEKILHAPYNKGQIFQDSDVGRDFIPSINPPSTPTTDATKQGMKTSIGKLIDSRIGKIVGLILLTLLCAFLTYKFGWN
jgi:hypothetical protein